MGKNKHGYKSWNDKTFSREVDSADTILRMAGTKLLLTAAFFLKRTRISAPSSKSFSFSPWEFVLPGAAAFKKRFRVAGDRDARKAPGFAARRG
jgi:hypothetical protein